MTDASDTPDPEQQRGLYSGFERYTTPTTEDYRAVMTSGLVVLDTNALLNLYRYTPRVRTTLLDLLAKAGDTLWEPDQVMLEFWRNREAATRDYDAAAREFDKSVTSAQNITADAIRALGNRIGLDDDHKKDLVRPIEEAFTNLSASVKRTMNHDGATAPSQDTSADPVLAALDPLLRGKVGKALNPEALQAALAEAKRRVAAKEPPGYMDAKKPDGGVGDFLVWRQLLDEASSRRGDALFVTGDVKEDWWRRCGGISSAGPRLELLDEFHAVVGGRLYLLQPADFLIKAAAIFGVKIPAASVVQARQIDENRNEHTHEVGAARYEYEVLKAIERAVGEIAAITPVNIDGRHSPADVEVRFRGERVGVIAKYASQSPVSWAKIAVDLLKVLQVGFEKVLVVTNVEIRNAYLIHRSARPGVVTYVIWRSAEDDDALRAAMEAMSDSEESSDGTG